MGSISDFPGTIEILSKPRDPTVIKRIPRMGFNRHMHQVVIYGPRIFGGKQIMKVHTEQTILHTEKFVVHL